jgi:hypothetical protein
LDSLVFTPRCATSLNVPNAPRFDQRRARDDQAVSGGLRASWRWSSQSASWTPLVGGGALTVIAVGAACAVFPILHKLIEFLAGRDFLRSAPPCDTMRRAEYAGSSQARVA